MAEAKTREINDLIHDINIQQKALKLAKNTARILLKTARLKKRRA
jgi:hypothetical protein